MERKVQVVLGGSYGMGYAVAKEIGALGPVIIGARSESKLNDAVESLKAEGVEAYGKTCDVGSMDSVRAFAEAASAIAPIGNVISVAGIAYNDNSIEDIIRVNALGTAYVDEVFFQYQSENSVLVNFASNTAYIFKVSEEIKEIWDNPFDPDFVAKCAPFASSEFVAYTLSKAFVIHHTKANAMRFGRKNCRILAISPGAYDTPMLRSTNTTPEVVEKIAAGTAFGRLGTPYEMACTVMAVIDPKLSYLTGADINVDGGKMAQSLVKQID